MKYPFQTGDTYTRNDVYEIVNVPDERRRGNWETGYNKYGDDLFIFCNMGVAGRSGHDYDNHWDGDDLIWRAKGGTHVGQPQIRWMQHPTGEIYLFTRESDRAPFDFEGLATAISVDDTSPVTIRWRIDRQVSDSHAESLKKLYRVLTDTRFQCVPNGEHHLRDVYDFVQETYPYLCDDTYLCSTNCTSGYNSPEWKHKVRTALWDLKRRGRNVRKSDQRGYWILGPNSPEQPPNHALKAADIGSLASKRVEVSIFRVLRDTELARRIKSLHQNQCQVCGLSIPLPDGSTYSEAHHIQPLGKPHNGPDIAANILVLCPNHHAMCDYGAILLDARELRTHPRHQIGNTFLQYHNSIIAAEADGGSILVEPNENGPQPPS